ARPGDDPPGRHLPARPVLRPLVEPVPEPAPQAGARLGPARPLDELSGGPDPRRVAPVIRSCFGSFTPSKAVATTALQSTPACVGVGWVTRRTQKHFLLALAAAGGIIGDSPGYRVIVDHLTQGAIRPCCQEPASLWSRCWAWCSAPPRCGPT